jgi:hypothetical protein
MRTVVSVLVFAIILAGAFFVQSQGAGFDQQQFKKYWNQGKAELTRYDLSQARYGEIHKGEAVLIFVTEPFLTDKQVKFESGDSSTAVQVLKLNFTRKFYTGIYPYSLMTSVFTPVDYHKNRTLKVTTSSQEWCGSMFLQMNFRNNHYDAQVRSYFQTEGDQNLTVNTSWLEDEIWTRIRLAPETLPIGNIDLVPGSQYIRLWHQQLTAQKAVATLEEEGNLRTYSIEYANIKRKVQIQFEKAFPYAITAWEETQPGGFGDSGLLTTRAVRTKSLLLDYWTKHNNKDAHYRNELGLTE